MRRPDKTNPLRVKRSVALSISFFAIFLFTGCLINSIQQKGAFDISEAILTNDFDKSNPNPAHYHRTTNFSSNDLKVTSVVKFKNLTGNHHIQWKWYSPNRRLYYATKQFPVAVAENRFVKEGFINHSISIRNEKAETLAGNWTVDIYTDGKHAMTNFFTLSSVTGGYPPLLKIDNLSLSSSVLEGGTGVNLHVTLKNIGPGDARDVYLDLSTDTRGIVFDKRLTVDTIPKRGGSQTVTIPIKGELDLQEGTGHIDIRVFEPNYKLKIRGKRLSFYTAKFRNPSLILARFAVRESESANKNKRINIQDIIELKLAVQNIGRGDADKIKLNVKNNQKGVMFVEMTSEGVSRHQPDISIDKIASGSYKVLTYRYFVNNDFSADKLKFQISAKETMNKYGFHEEKIIPINTTPEAEGKIQTVVFKKTPEKNIHIEELSELENDTDRQISRVDVTIPLTGMNNPDAVAVVIGNKAYRHHDFPEVSYAIRDASTIRKHLIKMMGYKKRNIIHRTNATTSDFNDIFGNRADYRGELFDLIKPGLSDVFIYYSGHGAPDAETDKGYLAPVNCKPTKIRMNGYPLDQFYANISRLPAKRITVVVDACFSGGTGSGHHIIKNASPIGINITNAAAINDNTICLNSSRGNQISSWHEESRHGLFTYYFLDAIQGKADTNGDKKITYHEIHRYVSDIHNGVPYYARRKHSRDQMPTIMGMNRDTVLVDLTKSRTSR